MPALNIALELDARIVDIVVVPLVVYRSRYAVSEHAFGQGRQRLRGVIAKIRRRRFCRWCLELVEFVFGCVITMLVNVSRRSGLRLAGSITH